MSKNTVRAIHITTTGHYSDYYGARSLLEKITLLCAMLFIILISSELVFSTEEQPEAFKAELVDGSPVGQLVLGKTTVDDAKGLFEKAGVELGQKRKNTIMFSVGKAELKPKYIYNPWATLYQLYFDKNNVLVMIVDGAPETYPKTKAAFLEKYKDARETDRESNWYEMQVPLSDCTTLIAVFNIGGADPGMDKLDSIGLAYTCDTK